MHTYLLLVLEIIYYSEQSFLFQFCRHLILSEKGHIEWKLMYFTLQKYYPTKEQYGDTLHFCRHCSILFWKVRVPHVLWGYEGKLAVWVLNGN